MILIKDDSLGCGQLCKNIGQNTGSCRNKKHNRMCYCFNPKGCYWSVLGIGTFINYNKLLLNLDDIILYDLVI